MKSATSRAVFQSGSGLDQSGGSTVDDQRNQDGYRSGIDSIDEVFGFVPYIAMKKKSRRASLVRPSDRLYTAL